MEKINLRAVFEKSGRAVFISHLDLMRTMQRAVKRSGIPVWYTQGFNPRIYLNFPLALSLGVTGRNEFMDFAVVEPVDFADVRDKLNAVMPGGLKILDVAEPVFENKDIGFAEYTIIFYSAADPSETLSQLNKMLAEDKIEADRHSKKKGTVRTDIKPHINILGTEAADGALRVDIRLPAGLRLNINSSVFTDAFAEYSQINFTKICAERTKILCENGCNFR